jgi:thioredoxin reductase (NADPH)
MLRILGRVNVEGAEFCDVQTGAAFVRSIDALLIRVGHEPNTEFLTHQLALDDSGYVMVKNSQATSVPGVFAVGDVTRPTAPTICSAVGDAAVAAKEIAARLAR